MASGSKPSLLIIVSVILTLQWPEGTEAFPSMPLSSLFANAVLRAQHLHLLATDTFKEFASEYAWHLSVKGWQELAKQRELTPSRIRTADLSKSCLPEYIVEFLQERSYIPEDQRNSNKNTQSAFCYSETIPAPTGKDDAQQKSDMELLRFSLTLIQSWLNPVQFLSRVFSNSLVFGTSDRVYEKLQDLEEGIQALMRELEDGSSWGLQLLRPTYDKFDVNLQNESSLMKNYGLLSCFKKDLHKVETYLKVMKCRRFGEINCTI